MAPEQGLPISPIQRRCNEIFAATPAIWDTLAGGKIYVGKVRPVPGGGTGDQPRPYFVWMSATDTPHGDQSSSFGEAGSSSTLHLHIFSDTMFSNIECLYLADQVKRALSGKAHTLEGFKTLTFLVNLLDCSPISTGYQAVLVIQSTTRTIASP
jgi:hypothetical protein